MMRNDKGQFIEGSEPWNKGITGEELNLAILFKRFRDFQNLKGSIRCKVCGRAFHRITLTHLEKHGLTMKEYRKRYPEAPYISEVEREKHSRMMLELGDDNWAKLPEVRDKNSKALKLLFSDKTNHPMYGKHHTPATIRKISEANTGVPSHRKGKTYEEEYGSERAKEIIQKIKNSMPDLTGENSPLFGVISYPKSYFAEGLGHMVRSSWEERVLMGFKRRGIEYIGYEPKRFEFMFKGTKTSYTPDTILGDGTIVEIKGPVFEETIERLRAFREQYPEKKIWIITGSQGRERIPESCYEKLTKVEDFL